MKSRVIIVYIISFFCFVACSSEKKTLDLPLWKQNQAVKMSDLRPANVNVTKVIIKVPKQKYNRALVEGGNLNSARLIEVFSSSQGNIMPPQYRVFDVQRGGIYELLHLRTADIIVAAGGYVIPDQSIFWQYLNMIGQLDGGSLEVIRAGRTFDLQYQFVE